MQWLSFGNVGLADIDCPVLFSLLGALTEDTVTAHGQYYTLREARLELRPYQRPYPPLWYPTSNPDTIPSFAVIAAGTVSVLDTSSAGVSPTYSPTLTFQQQGGGALPILSLSGNVVLAYNLVFLATIVLSGLGMYLLVRELTGQPLAAFLAGVLEHFVTFRVPISTWCGRLDSFGLGREPMPPFQDGFLGQVQFAGQVRTRLPLEYAA